MRAVTAVSMFVFAASSVAAFDAGAGQPSRGAGTLFACAVPGGKVATVTAEGDRVVYRYGRPGRPELTIAGTASEGKVFRQSHNHHAIQLRFVSGEYSYVVHSIPRSDILDNVPRSGLIVFRNGRRIFERACSPWAALDFFAPELEEMPGDGEGAPSVFD